MVDRTPPGFLISEKGWGNIGALVAVAIFSFAPLWISWRIVCSSTLVWAGYAVGRIAWRFVSTRSERRIVKETRRAVDGALLNSQRTAENPDSSVRKSTADALLLATKTYSAACAPAEERLNRILDRRANRLGVRANLVGFSVFALSVAPFTLLPWEQHPKWAVALFAVWLATVGGAVLVALIWTRKIPTA